VQFQEYGSPYLPVPVSFNLPNYGDPVTEITYPASGNSNQDGFNLSQYAVSNGSDTGLTPLAGINGVEIAGIQSDAYSNTGSNGSTSGGGLFDSSGHLIGTVTWSMDSGNPLAISSQLINFLSDFQYCTFGDYPATSSPVICCPYGQIYGTDGYCHTTCENATTYCLYHESCVNNKCVT
jgi:hypothetical protein